MRIGDVSRVTGITIAKLSRWLDRETLTPSHNDKLTRGTGDYRTFCRATINKIAIAEKLIELNIGPGPANIAAAHFTDFGNDNRAANELYKFDRTILIHTEGRTSIRNLDSDAPLSLVFGRSFQPATILDIGQIIKAVDEAIISNRKINK